MERIDYYKYHKSDFRLLIDIDTKYKGEDDSIVALTTADRFVFKFWTKDREKPYICSSTGGEKPVLKNCSILDEHRVMCNFDMAETDNQQLEPGRLMLEAEFILPDTDFEGDKHNNVKRYYTTSLILTADPDKDSEGDHTLIPLLIDCLRGADGRSAYEYAKEQGYEGTEEEFAEMLAQNARYGAILLGAEKIPAWESIKSQPTTVGTLVIYEDKLYKFDVARAANEEWDSTKVHLTSLWAEIDAMVKSDYEQVNIELKTEAGEPLPNVGVVVTVEGEEAPRNLTTDNMGKCTTNIPKGVEYIVEANAIEDYAEPAKVIRRAALPKRYIEIVYSAILDVEHVVVEADYADSSLGTATEIYVEIDGEEFTIPLEGNQATFDVDFGKTYTISFQSVDGYMTPHTRTYKAMHASTKLVIARYMKPIDNVKWLMADGTLREVNNVTDEERLEGNIYGCVVGNSELVTNQKCYTIPTQYLLSGMYPYAGNYLSQNIQITAIGFYDTHAKALLDIDGEFNCAKIREFISEKASQGVNISSSVAQTTYNTYGGYEEFNSNRDYYAGRSVVYEGNIYQFRSRHNKAEWNGNDVQMLYAGFDLNRSYMVGETVFGGGFLWTFKSAHNAGDAWNTSEVNRTNGWIMPDGTLKHAFTPAYGQLYAYRNIRNDLNTVTQSIFSAQCLPISGANIWTSTQCYAQYGVCLSNGGFGTNGKGGSNSSVLPVLAYSD